MAKVSQEEFYQGLDEYKNSKSSCSCLSFALLIAVILVATELMLFYIARGIRFNPSEIATKGEVTENTSFSALENGNSVEVIVTEGILCSKLAKSRGQENIGCSINDDGVIISGKLATFLPSNASILVLPTVAQDSIIYQVKSVEVGKFKVSSFLAPTIAGALERVIAPDLKGIKVVRIDLNQGIMVIVGERIN